MAMLFFISIKSFINFMLIKEASMNCFNQKLHTNFQHKKLNKLLLSA